MVTICTCQKLYQRRIEATDEEIDALVHELYGLTEEEMAIVQGRDRRNVRGQPRRSGSETRPYRPRGSASPSQPPNTPPSACHLAVGVLEASLAGN